MDQIIYSAHQWFLACYIISWLWQGHEISPWSKYFSPSVMDCTVLCVKVTSILLVEMKIISQTRDREIFYFFCGARPWRFDKRNDMVGSITTSSLVRKKNKIIYCQRDEENSGLWPTRPRKISSRIQNGKRAIRQKRSCWKGNFGMWKEDG